MIGLLDIESHGVGAGLDGRILDRPDQSAADARAPRPDQEAQVYRSPFGLAAIEVKPTDRLLAAIGADPLDQPEVRVGIALQVVLMLQAELVRDESLLLRLRPWRSVQVRDARLAV